MADSDKSNRHDRDYLLGMHKPIERRDLLQGMLLGAGLLSLAGCGSAAEGDQLAAAAPQNQPGYYPPERVGMRGNHPGSFEQAHALRDGTLKPEHALKTGEEYDLVVVGGGISGLAAAYFLRAERPNARILILDNHDDFGGHAKRNEFHINGQMLLQNGGTMLISSPRPYGPVPAGLMRDLGIDAKTLAETYPNDPLYRTLGLGSAIYFDKENFGEDKLVQLPGGRGGGSRAELAAALTKAPLSKKAQQDYLRLMFDEVDYLPGLSEAEKRKLLSSISYQQFLEQYMKLDPAVITLMQKRTHGEWGLGIDAEPALDCWGEGLPGMNGLGLSRDNTDWMDPTAAGHSSTGGSDSFRFPDGNATIARALVRSLVPAVAPPGDIESIVLAKFDYSQLDRPGQQTRIRLNSTVVHVDPKGKGPVTIAYMDGDQLRSVSAKAAVLACYNMIIPYLMPGLPDAQKAALHELVKVPLCYTSVVINNWQAFQKLGVQQINCPNGYFSSVSLSSSSHVGGYAGPKSPDDPAIVFLSRAYCQPGLPTARDQQRAGRYELLNTSFEDFERNIRSQLNQLLGAGGFDAARDIEAIAVNRWPHGYAYEYNTLYDAWDTQEAERPNVIGRQRFGAVTIANSDAGSVGAYTDSAIEQGYRAVHELLEAELI